MATNLTLHPIWHTFMPMYEHAVGIGTICLSSLALYLILTKTPQSGKSFAKYLIAVQISITLVDINYGFLFCPISLFPLPAGLCNGILCTWFGFSGHVGNTIQFFTVMLEAFALLCCFHYKYVSIGEITSGASISEKRNYTFRVITLITLLAPCMIELGRHCHFEDGTPFIKSNYPSLYYLFDNPDYRAYSYDTTYFPLYRFVLFSLMIIDICAVTVLVIYFVIISFVRLSRQNSLSQTTRRMQQKTMVLLIVQMFPPVGIQMTPIFLFTVSLTTGSMNPNIANVLVCIQLTHTFFHTGIMILTTPSYREPFIFWQNRKVSITSTFSHRL